MKDQMPPEFKQAIDGGPQLVESVVEVPGMGPVMVGREVSTAPQKPKKLTKAQALALKAKTAKLHRPLPRTYDGVNREARRQPVNPYNNFGNPVGMGQSRRSAKTGQIMRNPQRGCGGARKPVKVVTRYAEKEYGMTHADLQRKDAWISSHARKAPKQSARASAKTSNKAGKPGTTKTKA